MLYSICIGQTGDGVADAFDTKVSTSVLVRAIVRTPLVLWWRVL